MNATGQRHQPAAPAAATATTAGVPGCRMVMALGSQGARARSRLYGFFSSVYLQPPDRAWIQRVTTPGFLEQLCRMMGEETSPDPEIDGSGLQEEALRQQYMDLFAVPTGRYVAPFEDVHWGDSGEDHPRMGPLLGPRAIAVRRMYRAAGLEMDPGFRELPTHAGVELAFAGRLCQAEAAAPTSRDSGPGRAGDANPPVAWRRLEACFLEEHLRQWFPSLRRAICQRAEGGFYPFLAGLTERFLAWESAFLEAARRDEPGPAGPLDEGEPA